MELMVTNVALDDPESEECDGPRQQLSGGTIRLFVSVAVSWRPSREAQRCNYIAIIHGSYFARYCSARLYCLGVTIVCPVRVNVPTDTLERMHH